MTKWPKSSLVVVSLQNITTKFSAITTKKWGDFSCRTELFRQLMWCTRQITMVWTSPLFRYIHYIVRNSIKVITFACAVWSRDQNFKVSNIFCPKSDHRHECANWLTDWLRYNSVSSSFCRFLAGFSFHYDFRSPLQSELLLFTYSIGFHSRMRSHGDVPQRSTQMRRPHWLPGRS